MVWVAWGWECREEWVGEWAGWEEAWEAWEWVEWAWEEWEEEWEMQWVE